MEANINVIRSRYTFAIAEKPEENLRVANYNPLKLPNKIKVSSNTGTVDYIYDALGNKLAVKQGGTMKNVYCGDFVYNTSLAVDYILTPNGQLTRNPSTGAYTAQYNITDHLGNVRSVVSSGNTVLQSTDYYPFGLAFSDANITNNRYLYNGKELEDYTVGTSYLGALDYGARHYDPRIARWTVPDPMAEKYYGVNAYSLCYNNPMNLIDLDGNDVWEINRKGEIVNRVVDQTQDAFYIVSVGADGKIRRSQTIDADGNMIDVRISFEYGTVTNNRTPTVNVINSDGKIILTKLTIFEIKGDKEATQLFEFLANPMETTNVEWTHAKVGKDNSGRNIVGSSHNQSSTAIGHYLRKNSYTLREINHNHPSGIGIPSKGDLQGAAEYLKNNSKALLNIYTHPGQYHRYNQNGLY